MDNDTYPVVGGIVAIVLIPLFAWVMMTDNSSNNWRTAQVAQYQACQTIHDEKLRLDCINPPNSEWTAIQDAVNQCANTSSIYGTDDGQCVQKAIMSIQGFSVSEAHTVTTP